MSRRAPTQHELDMQLLLRNVAFRRFLLRICSKSGIHTPTAGADHVLPYREGRRSLGLEILQEAAAGIPGGTSVEHVLALILSEANPQETPDEDAEASPRD